MLAGNLAALPLPDASVDVVVNFQVIEHLWDQPQFVAECARVLRPGGLLLMSTPNRITFSPGRDTPINPFHTRELNAAELAELLTDGGFEMRVDERGVPRPGPGWRWTSATAARSSTPRSSGRWPTPPGPTTCWPTWRPCAPRTSTLLDEGERDIDDSLDLVAIAVRV